MSYEPVLKGPDITLSDVSAFQKYEGCLWHYFPFLVLVESANLLSSVFLQLMHASELADGQNGGREKGKNVQAFFQPCFVYLHP